MLIGQQKHEDRLQDSELPSPVVGVSTDGSVPTSSEVHLYSDPKTYVKEYPLLYADCEGPVGEGLEGGENTRMPESYHNNLSSPLNA